jgi:prepilin-type N-terminal cleavage/methylation domain-containing protein/prepilin-type processing-associated H-X9-DG protein
MHPQKPRQSAFTLIELLTVVAVVAVLAAILIPAIGKVRHSANSSKSVSNLREIGKATSLFTAQNKGVFPLLNRRPSNPNSASQFFWSQALEEEIFDWDRSVSGTHPIFVDPTAEKNHKISDYGGSTYVFLDANPNNPARSEAGLSLNSILNPSETLIVCTAYAKSSGAASWYVQGNYALGGNPDNIPQARLGQNEVGVVFADGHVELLSEEKVNELDFRRKLFDPSVL